ncbi:MAG: 2-succinyl-6-hydroxy-2,4-cyclohexadiene-1-carboxylate synthase [Bdellovibrionales bacterium]|nr:2-succinyl-6-hydroxy-2,4-cyclohexadiene-1-carboxylate synthase [Bdellovibrionales bacterium]
MNFEFSVEQRGRSAGWPVVFLHGFMGSASDWGSVIARLEDEFCCYAVDLPGHGGATPAGSEVPLEFTALARRLMETIHRLDDRPVHIVGYSLGGRLALAAACSNAARVRSLVLESASPGIADATERRERERSDDAWAEKIERHGIEDFLQEWYAQPVFRSLAARPDLLESLLRERSTTDPVWAAKCLRELGVGRQPEVWSQLGGLAVPTLLVTGEEDTRFTALAGRMESLMPQAAVAVVPAAGHNVHLEQPDTFAGLIRDFFDRGESQLRSAP